MKDRNWQIESHKRQFEKEAESFRFQARVNGEKPACKISYGFSEIDPTTNEKYTWDLWLKFPFKVKKTECEKFKELIHTAFETCFLAQEKGK